jgi:glycosyltransferase involved in cell wall biosynthesis
MKCSVIIPARNSARTLGKTLDALYAAGERRPDEILVIDGCSGDGTAELARSYGARVVVNEKQHVAAARQLGVTAALHEIIAFTDSDCIPSPDWLRSLVGHFQRDSQLDGVGGRVVLTAPRNQIQRYSAHVFESIMRFPHEEVLVTTKGMPGSFAGANCAYRKVAVLAAGGFREEFTNHAEEIDLFWRLINRRAKLLFDPVLQVEHLEYPDTLTRLVRTNFNYGFASTKLAKYHIGAQVDLQLYGVWLSSFASLLNPFRRDPWDGLRCLQIGTFIAGKICSSIALRTLNL